MLVYRTTWGTAAENAVYLVEAIDGWTDREQIMLDMHWQQLKQPEGTQLVPAVVMPYSWAVAAIPQWVIDHSVMLRQELQFGICEHETAGYYAKCALAELAREAPLGMPGYFIRRLNDGAFIFAPAQEIEALRVAVCRFLWREMLFCKDVRQFEVLAHRLVPVANTEAELTQCVAAFYLLSKPFTPALQTALECLPNDDAKGEFPSLYKTAEILVSRFRPELREQLS